MKRGNLLRFDEFTLGLKTSKLAHSKMHDVV